MRLSALALLAAVAVVPAAVLLWPHLPPLHEDEILPLTPLFLLKKVPEAYGGGFLAGCPHSLWGVPLPLTSYVIEGPIKALFYAAAYPATRWAYVPEYLVDFYRASNLPFTWALFAIVLLACARLGGRVAALLGAGFLATDVALVYLGVTDLGRPLHLLAGVALALALAAQVERPRWRNALVVAVVVLLGEWDRADFLWFMAAGLAGTALACVVTPPRQWVRVGGPVLLGYALGLGAVALVVPQYLQLAAEGAGKRIPLTDLPRLAAHLQALLYGVDPLGSFQRHFDVGVRSGDAPYVAYRRAYVALVAWSSLGLAAVGLRDRRRALLVFAVFPAGLLVQVVATAESYLVHHTLVVKPFLYVALAALLARGARTRRGRVPALAAGVALVVASAAVQARAFADPRPRADGDRHLRGHLEPVGCLDRRGPLRPAGGDRGRLRRLGTGRARLARHPAVGVDRGARPDHARRGDDGTRAARDGDPPERPERLGARPAALSGRDPHRLPATRRPVGIAALAAS